MVTYDTYQSDFNDFGVYDHNDLHDCYDISIHTVVLDEEIDFCVSDDIEQISSYEAPIPSRKTKNNSSKYVAKSTSQVRKRFDDTKSRKMKNHSIWLRRDA